MLRKKVAKIVRKWSYSESQAAGCGSLKAREQPAESGQRRAREQTAQTVRELRSGKGCPDTPGVPKARWRIKENITTTSKNVEVGGHLQKCVQNIGSEGSQKILGGRSEPFWSYPKSGKRDFGEISKI